MLDTPGFFTIIAAAGRREGESEPGVDQWEEGGCGCAGIAMMGAGLRSRSGLERNRLASASSVEGVVEDDSTP